jgi:endonuclease YncB( thermonuclease family)
LSGKGDFIITGFINVPLQRHYRGDPDGNTLWLWNPSSESTDVQPDLSLDSPLKIVKQGHAPQPYLKIRFEGIDTPETHFNGGEEAPGPFLKQNYGYLARDLLFQLIGDVFESTPEGPLVKLECRFIKNKRFYDSHKRVIGQLYLDTQDESINFQMVESGYAFPLFYESMDPGDMKKMKEAAQKAYDRDAGCWREYTVTPVNGNPPVVGNDTGEINDWGDVNYPKFWRRWVSYNYDPNGIHSQTFTDWLAVRKDNALAKGSSVKLFSDSVSPHDYRLKVMPWDFIFRDD